MPDQTAGEQLPTCMIFVDGTHVDHRCQEAFNRLDLDFGKFFQKLANGKRLSGIVYCVARYKFDDWRKHQSGVLNRLRSISPTVKVYHGRHMTRTFHCKKCRHEHLDQVEKGTDVAVASHLVQAACCKEADELILVSGDNDYWPALEVARQAGANCRFAFFCGPDENRNKIFNEVAMLRNNSRNWTVLDDAFLADCWYVPPQKGR